MYIPHFFFRETVTALGVVLCGLGLLLSGCDQTAVTSDTPQENSSSPSETSSEDDESLPPDVRLRIEYDQTEVTYSKVWPGSIVGNNAKRRKAKEEGAKLMTEFERTHEVRSYDDEGYLSASYEYLNGNHPDMNMPAEAHEDLKSEMPYDPTDENPVVRSVLEGNEMRYIREDGSVTRSRSIDPEAFRIRPAKLDSLEVAREDTSSVDSRRSEILGSLRQRGISFRRLDQNRVSFEQSVGDVRGTSRLKKVVDLRFGKPIYLKYELKNGNTDMVETRRYTKVSGLPIMVKSVTYDYDNRAGSWKVVTRTEVKRQNLSIRFN